MTRKDLLECEKGGVFYIKDLFALLIKSTVEHGFYKNADEAKSELSETLKNIKV